MAKFGKQPLTVIATRIKTASVTPAESNKPKTVHQNPSKRKASSQRPGFSNNDRTGTDLAGKPTKSHTYLPQGLGSLGKEGFKVFSHYFKQTALQIMKRVTSALAFGIRRDTGPPSCHRGPNWAAWLSPTTNPDHQDTGPATWLVRPLSGAGLASTSPATQRRKPLSRAGLTIQDDKSKNRLF